MGHLYGDRVIGVTALGSEVLWTRTLSLLFGATTYTFSLILAVFLFGLGIGSSIGAALAGRLERPRLALGWCQMLLCAAMAWTSSMLTESLPFWPINPSINTTVAAIEYVPVGLRPRDVGDAASRDPLGSFPLALASVAGRGQDPGRVVGGVYSANTLGAIAGAVGGSLLLTIWLGSQRSQQLMIVVSAISALLTLDAALVESDQKKRRFQFAGTLLLAAAMAGAVPHPHGQVPPILVAYGRYAATRVRRRPTSSIWVRAGTPRSPSPNSPTRCATTTTPARCRPRAEPQDMRLQRMLMAQR